MADDGALNLRLPQGVAEGLARMAAHRNRTPSELVADAVVAMVRGDEAVRAGIERGLADMRAGRLVPHDEAMDELDAAVEAAVRR